MATKKIEIRPKGSGDYADVLYPKTSTDMVVDEVTGRTVATQLMDIAINVKSFGAKGDGVTDDTSAFQNAINQVVNSGGGILYIPKGKYKVTSTLTVSGRVSIHGAGSDFTDMDNFVALNSSVSAIVWAGGASPIFNLPGIVGGFSWKDFAIDGANLASIGVNIDQMRNSTWENVVIMRCTKGIKILPVDGGVANQNTMFNTFTRLSVLRCSNCIDINGTGISNTCHNTFINTVVDYTGTDGILMNDSDNNTFIMLYGFSRGASGYTVRFQNMARSNYFLHFQGSIKAESGSKNSVFSFDRENGQVRPTVDSGAELFWTENGNNASGWRMTSPLEALSVELLGDYTVANGLTPSPNAFRIHRSNNQLLTWDFVDSSRKARLTYYDGTAPDVVQYMTLNGTGIESYIMGGMKVTSGTIPISGTWNKGDYVKNNNPSVSGTSPNKYVVKGWIRLTTGSGNVLNTDWVEDRALTGT